MKLLILFLFYFQKNHETTSQIVLPQCEELFQYVIYSVTPFGLVKLHIPRSKAFGFNITFMFEFSHTTSSPALSVSIRKGSKPMSLLEDIVTGKKVQLIIRYPRMVANKLIHIKLDETYLCGEPFEFDASDTEAVSPVKLEANNILEWKTYSKLDFPFRVEENVIEKFKKTILLRLNQENCGISPFKLQQTNDFLPLAAGGERVLKIEYPWVGKMFDKNEVTCTVNFVSKNIAIAAAHCVYEKNYKNFRIELFNTKNVTIWDCIIHYNYRGTRLHDIVLIFLNEDISDDYFTPICLPKEEKDFDYGEMISYGQDEFGEIGNIKRLHLQTVNEQTCRESHASLSEVVKHEHFCGKSTNIGSGPQTGDSGSGLAVKENGKWHLRGILSECLKDLTTSRCDTSNFAIFSDVSKYSTWIDKTIGQKNKSSVDSQIDPCNGGEYNFEQSLYGYHQYWIVSIYHSYTSPSISINGTYLGQGALISPEWVITSTFLIEPETWHECFVEVRYADGQPTIVLKKIIHEWFNLGHPEVYNIVLLKTLVHFPLSLICLNRWGSKASEAQTHASFNFIAQDNLSSRSVENLRYHDMIKVGVSKPVSIIETQKCNKHPHFRYSSSEDRKMYFCLESSVEEPEISGLNYTEVDCSVSSQNVTHQLAFNRYTAENGNFYLVLVGIQSFGSSFIKFPYLRYDVMTNVTALIEWIDKNIKGN